MQDLSSRLPSAPLTGNSSMHATNTVTDETGSMTAPGSPSEASTGARTESPGPSVPAVQGPSVGTTGSGYSPSPVSWKAAPA